MKWFTANYFQWHFFLIVHGVDINICCAVGDKPLSTREIYIMAFHLSIKIGEERTLIEIHIHFYS